MKMPGDERIQRRAIALTEYLIILALIAIATIAVIAYFGQQVKSTYTRSNKAMVGEKEAADLFIAEIARTNVIADDMGSFTRGVTNR